MTDFLLSSFSEYVKNNVMESIFGCDVKPSVSVSVSVVFLTPNKHSGEIKFVLFTQEMVNNDRINIWCQKNSIFSTEC